MSVPVHRGWPGHHLLSGRECLLPRLSGIGQDNNGRGALQPVKGDPPSRSGRGQDEVADV
jgi:hypothetical protein